MIFLTYFLLVLLLVFALVLLLFFVLTAESMVRGHDLPTSTRATKALVSTIRKYNPDAKCFYDLGCAHGALSMRLKKVLPQLEIYGMDNGVIRILFARLKSKILGHQINFQKQDIFKTDLQNADVVYTYLWYDHMPILEKKLQAELKPGAVVITNTSHFQDWPLAEKIVTCPRVSNTPDFETLFVYVKE